MVVSARPAWRPPRVAGLPRTMAGDESIVFSLPNCWGKYDAFHY
jgi:hypothetical protein